MRRSPLRIYSAAGILVCLAATWTQAALTPVWETILPGADNDAFVILDATGNPRVLSQNNSNQFQYFSFNRDGTITNSGVFPASSDGNFRTTTGAGFIPDEETIACGNTVTNALFPAAPTVDSALVRFGVSGAPLWNRILSDADTGLCGWKSMGGCLSTGGFIYGVGTTSPPFPPSPTSTCGFFPNNFGSFLIKVNQADGSVLAHRSFSNAGDGTFYTAVGSSAAVVYALGTRPGPAGTGMVLDRYDTNLNLVWGTAFDIAGVTPIAVAVSSTGRIAALGQRGTADARITRFEADGAFSNPIVIPTLTESKGLALTSGATIYIAGRRSPLGASFVSISPDDTVTTLYESTSASRFVSVAVDAEERIYAVLNGITGDVRLVRLAFSSATAPSLLSINGGDNQIAGVGTDLPNPLTALLLNTSSAPTAGATLRFSISSAPGTGASVTPPDATTDLDGLGHSIFRVGSLPLDYKITCSCPTCGAGTSTVTFTACGKLQTEELRQGDPAWAGATLGNHPKDYTIRETGCALTSVANLIDFYGTTNPAIPHTDPLQLNTAMIAGHGYTKNDDVDWRQVGRFAANQITFVAESNLKASNTLEMIRGQIDADLALRRPVIVKGEHPPFGHSNFHFMLITGKCGENYVVADPASPTGHRLYSPLEPQLQLRGIRRYAPQ